MGTVTDQTKKPGRDKPMSLFSTLRALDEKFIQDWNSAGSTQAAYDTLQEQYIADYNAAMDAEAERLHESDPPGHPVRP